MGIRLAILALPAVGGFFYAFLPDASQASFAVVIVAVARALVTGVAEELGWRAVHVRLFPEQPVLGWIAWRTGSIRLATPPTS